MGAWSHEPFGNDSALDWAGEYLENPSIMVLEKLFKATIKAENIESDLGASVIVAAEVVARLKGKWGKRDSYSEEIDKWVVNNPQKISKELCQLAGEALDKILSPQSELAELWIEDDTETLWVSSVKELKDRVLI